jgi:hypothetical protein
MFAVTFRAPNYNCNRLQILPEIQPVPLVTQLLVSDHFHLTIHCEHHAPLRAVKRRIIVTTHHPRQASSRDLSGHPKSLIWTLKLYLAAGSHENMTGRSASLTGVIAGRRALLHVKLPAARKIRPSSDIIFRLILLIL